MKKLLLTLFCLLAVGGSALAQTAETWTYTAAKDKSSNEWAKLRNKTSFPASETFTLNEKSWTATISATQNNTSKTWANQCQWDGTASGYKLGGPNYSVDDLTLVTTAFAEYNIEEVSFTAKSTTANVTFALTATVANTTTTSANITNTKGTATVKFPAGGVKGSDLKVALTHNSTTNGGIIVCGMSVKYSIAAAGPTEVAISSTAVNDEITMNVDATVDAPIAFDPATATPTIKYTISEGAADGLTFDGNKITAVKAGDYIVDAAIVDDNSFVGKEGAKEVSFFVTVSKLPVTLSLPDPENPHIEMTEGQTMPTPVICDPKGLELVYTILDPETEEEATGLTYADGVFTAVTKGEYYVMATFPGNDKYLALESGEEAMFVITVKERDKFEGITFTPAPNAENRIELKAGESFSATSTTADAIWTVTTVTDRENKVEPVAYNLGTELTPAYRAAAWNYIFTATIGEESREYPVVVKVSRHDIKGAFASEVINKKSSEVSNGTVIENTLNLTGVQEGHEPFITYSIEGDAIGTIDAATGKLTLNGSLGSATVTARIGGDENNDMWYNVCTAKYTISINDLSAVTFDFTTAKKNGEVIKDQPYGLFTTSGNDFAQSTDNNVAVNEGVTATMSGTWRVYMGTSSDLRLAYGKNDPTKPESNRPAGAMTVAAPTGYKIVSIVFNHGATNYLTIDDEGTATSEIGTNQITFTSKGDQTSLSFTFTKTSGNSAIKTMVVNLAPFAVKIDSKLTELFNGKALTSVDHKKGTNAYRLDEGEFFCDSSLDDNAEAFKAAFVASVKPTFEPVRFDDLSDEEKKGYDNEAMAHYFYQDATVEFNNSGELILNANHAGEYEITIAVAEGNEKYLPATASAKVIVAPNFDGLWLQGATLVDNGSDTFNIAVESEETPDKIHISAIDPGHNHEHKGNKLEYYVEWNTPATYARSLAPADADWKEMKAEGFDLRKDGQNAKALHLRLTTNGQSVEKSYMIGDVTTGVEGIEIEEGEVIYFDLNGNRVANPDRGIYIRVNGTHVDKIML